MNEDFNIQINVLKNGFELHNLINERIYTVNSLTKMTNLRGICAGQFLVARIINYDNDYYLVEIANVLSETQKGEAYKYAVMKSVQNPELVYKDNPEKEKEIKSNIADMYKKFIKKFDTDEIITSNKHADDIIGSFCDDEVGDLREKITPVNEYRYFTVPELQNTYNQFMENSVGGFATHNATYDVGIVFDKEKGCIENKKKEIKEDRKDQKKAEREKKKEELQKKIADRNKK